MIINKKKYVQLSESALKKSEEERHIKDMRSQNEQKEYNERTNKILNNRSQYKNKIQVENVFRHEVKKTLLYESLYYLLDESLGVQIKSDYNDNIKKNIVCNFINENNIDHIIDSFKGKSLLLSEMYRVINQYTDSICEQSKNKQEPNAIATFELDVDNKDNFFNDLKTNNVNTISTLIRKRVTNSVNNFIDQNSKDQLEIKDIIQQCQDNMNKTDSDAVKESYELVAKKNIQKIRNNRSRNIFESMVLNICKSTMQDKTLLESYSNNGKLNMDKIVENTTVLYTFLEMLNSTKIENIDASYINETLKDLTK